MRFRIGPYRYTARICAGELRENGVAVDAILHDNEILISGSIALGHRWRALVDQLRRIHEDCFGIMGGDAIATFNVDMMRQLRQQGDEVALMRMTAPDTEAPADFAIAAEPVGCECGQCGTRYGSHQITTASAQLDPRLGIMVVKRCVECDFCNRLMSWTEGATSLGAPNGRVIAGPEYSGVSGRVS